MKSGDLGLLSLFAPLHAYKFRLVSLQLAKLLQEGFVEEQAQQGYTRGWEGEGGSFDKLAKLL